MSARFASVVERVLLAATLAWLAPAAARACDVVVVPASTTIRLDYDPFAFARTAAQLAFVVESRAPEPCEGDVVLLNAARVAVAEQDVAGTGVVVSFSANAGEATLRPTATPGVWRVRFEPGARTRLSLTGMVTQDAVATAGEHGAELTLEVRAAGAASASVGAIPVHVVLAAQPRAQMNIVGAAGTFGQGPSIARVDFGDIDGDKTRRVFLQVRANTSARLTIASTNRGLLLGEDAPAPEAGIRYTAQLADEAIDLTRHWERLVEPPHTIAGTSLPLDLIVRGTGAHAAGVYSDVLTIELSAL